MEANERYEVFLRRRISELLAQRGISEHRMSLELGKSGSYIRAITNGLALPSVKELFNIITYFEIGPAKFFEGLDDDNSLRASLCNKLQELDEDDLQKLALFIDWIQKP
ncbi:XRE family transcriptional regulator [Pseudoflavonifractor sp. 524-17]|uniref:helix-turn-helix domain-containing protein n=1 Tax=Pseudoflavonifractor sp. 524-17 TaxID=2304577 RepID=UPI00137B75F7|nr:helix-turn-helix transcriptional regulator [Pseudoflavonifractor sp. 524-17]NCE63200.1 XRE family transcriptional regulator [Pseudoflavonifractor sp. 524-17]